MSRLVVGRLVFARALLVFQGRRDGLGLLPVSGARIPEPRDG